MRKAWEAAVDSGVDYDFYLWLNDDVEFSGGALRGIYANYGRLSNNNKDDGIIVGTFRNSPEEERLTYGVFDREAKIVKPSGRPIAVDGDSMSGNLVLVPKSVFRDVGIIYDGYMHGNGDNDYRQLVQRKGYKVYAPSEITGICRNDREGYVNIALLSFAERVWALFAQKGLLLHDIFLYRYRH